MVNTNRKFIVAGLVVCLAGAWLILRPSAAGPAQSIEDSMEHAAGSRVQEAPQGESGGPTLRSEQIDPTDPEAAVEEADAEPDPQTRSTPTGSELERLTLQTIPPSTATAVDMSTEADSDCDDTYAGLGVEFRAWGDVLLPYTPGYPTSEPGEVWDCTADTVFGGAIAMVHAAYLEALRPETIPSIAVDTPGRSIRIDRQRGSNAVASLGFLCGPVGWNWNGVDTWSLLHQCGEGEAHVSYYQMRNVDGRWWLVYPPSGLIETELPPEGYAYYPFIGGD